MGADLVAKLVTRPARKLLALEPTLGGRGGISGERENSLNSARNREEGADSRSE